MPLPININELLRGKSVEWERLEFKEGWNPLGTLHTICAFANDFHNLGGGYIVVGVGEKSGQPILPPQGLDPGSTDAIQKEILNLGHSAIQPDYHAIVVPYEIDGRTILVIWAPGGQTRPYRAKLKFGKNAKEYGYFIRKGSSTVLARGADETELLSLAATVPFDDRINQRAKVDDLSRDLMQEYLQHVGSDLAKQSADLPLLELGRQMGVIGGPDEAPFPLNVGLMMFNPEPYRFFPAMQIDVVWFPKEGPGGNKFSEKIFKGPLPRMTRDALDYIKRNFLSETVIKHPGRAESSRVENIPYIAIEEAVVNAVYHRGYDVREPVEIRIMHDELVVLSYPGPDRSVRLEQLRSGKAMPRRYRNRRIGEFLKELEFTEGRSTGIPKIIDAMQANGSPPAEFDFDEDHSYFMVRLPVHPAALEVADSGVGELADAVTGQVTGQGGTKSALSQHQVEIMKQCREERPIGDLMEIAKRTDRTKFRNQVLNPLLNAGLLEMTTPDKPRSSKQKYRLTEKGRAVLASLERREA
jgi:ATP-dependent DNA helicase RecG